jgi:hypothetical protein
VLIFKDYKDFPNVIRKWMWPVGWMLSKVSSCFVLLFGRGNRLMCPRETWAWSQVLLYDRAALEGLGDMAAEASGSEGGFLAIFGGLFAIYFVCVEYWYIEGHKSSILKYCDSLKKETLTCSEWSVSFWTSWVQLWGEAKTTPPLGFHSLREKAQYKHHSSSQW